MYFVMGQPFACEKDLHTMYIDRESESGRVVFLAYSLFITMYLLACTCMAKYVFV